MSNDTKSALTVILLFAALLIALWLWKKNKGVSSVSITTSEGHPIFQECTYKFVDNGEVTIESWPSYRGPCPPVVFIGQREARLQSTTPLTDIRVSTLGE